MKVVPRDHKQKFIWVSECTQANFISAFVEHRAPLLGFAPKGEGLNTKRFNCHKVIENQLGHAFEIEDKKSFGKYWRNL